jgi:hypothetical protein
MTLQMLPKRWYSQDLSVMGETGPVADIDLSWWREKAVLTIDGKPYRAYREGLVSGDFILESAGTVVARAEKPSAWRRTLVIRHEGRGYELRAASAFRREFVLWAGSRQIGTVGPKHAFSRKAAVDLPDELPLPVRVFIIWLAAILWMRDSAGAAA